MARSVSFTSPAEKPTRAQQECLWVQDALEGNAKAYEQLLLRYRQSLYHLVLKMVRNPDDAQDLTIQVFTRAFRYLSYFKPDYAFSTWLFRIATNCSISFIQRKKLQTVPLNGLPTPGKGASLTDLPDYSLDPQQMLIRQQRIDLVQQVVNQLPSHYAHLVRLHYFEEMRYEEIAAMLKMPMGTVKAQLFRARALLRELLEGSKVAL